MSETNQLAKPAERFKLLLSEKRDDLAVVCGPAMPVELLFKTIGAAAMRNPDIAGCSPVSILGAAMFCAEVGLLPGPSGHVYLVPYKGVCTPIVGYKGMVHLAMRAGAFSHVGCAVVRSGDVFEHELGTTPRLRHVVRTTMKDDMTHVYCVAHMKDRLQPPSVEIMGIDEVNAVRQKYSKMGGGPWASNFAEMAKKTVLRRAAKYWPLPEKIMHAFGRVDQVEAAAYSDEAVETTAGAVREVVGTQTSRAPEPVNPEDDAFADEILGMMDKGNK